ncbi:DUF4867 family protein [Anaerobium acetethylicum]|uniref:DUF4867 domain-containing protein n=1 Tax=Anaerobium acetethylicum TaxID=1619234 RepID=A0A1D3TQG3_9FIRM|nr:DUF4867 family protein [Anaerobium acetethylicum]SCP95799.1 protein of unknown function [Anaerobium acetethylicum]
MALTIKSVEDRDFRKYGRIVKGYGIAQLLQAMESTPVPEDVIYTASVREMEDTADAAGFRDFVFGGMPIQIGFCNGHNNMLNALEYHRNSEINIAVTDMVLLLGMQQDMEDDFTYDSAKVEAFLVPAGTAVELYGTTLHYAPCGVDGKGFKGIVILPEGTNTELEAVPEKNGEDALLFAKNKWLVAHQESGLEADGAFIGLKGENLSI